MSVSSVDRAVKQSIKDIQLSCIIKQQREKKIEEKAKKTGIRLKKRLERR